MKKFLSFLYPFVRGTCTENGILDFSCRQVPIYNSFPFKEKHTKQHTILILRFFSTRICVSSFGSVRITKEHLKKINNHQQDLDREANVQKAHTLVFKQKLPHLGHFARRRNLSLLLGTLMHKLKVVLGTPSKSNYLPLNVLTKL